MNRNAIAALAKEFGCTEAQAVELAIDIAFEMGPEAGIFMDEEEDVFTSEMAEAMRESVRECGPTWERASNA